MLYKPEYFSLDEMVCPHVYSVYGHIAWQFFSPRLIITLDVLRKHFEKPIYVNNWQIHGQFSQRGFRCIQCELVKKAVREKRMYVSPHMTGQGADFDVQGMTAEEVREWIVANSNLLPYPIRLENNVSWVHLDVRDVNKEKVYLFNP